MPRRAAKQVERSDSLLTRVIVTILLFTLAAIITLSFFDRAGALGVMLNEFILSALFGSIRYSVPFILIMLGWFLISDRKYDYRSTHGIGALLFFLTAASLMHLHFDPNDMWLNALSGHGGGIFGMPAWILKTYLGDIASVILLIATLCISVVLMFNTSLAHFVMLNKKMIGGLGGFWRGLAQVIQLLFVPSDVRARAAEQDEDDEFEEDEPFDVAQGEDDEEDIEQETDEDDPFDSAQGKERRFEKKPLSVPQAQAVLRKPPTPEQTDDEGPQEPQIPTYLQHVIIRNLPPVPLLSEKKGKPNSGDIKQNGEIIRETLKEFNIDVEMGEVRVGPTVTQFSFKPAKGVKLARITGLSNDLALALAAHPIRIEAPIPGQALVGIEVPNQRTALVTLRELLESPEFLTRKHNLMIGLGKDVGGKVWFADLPRMPHLLIAGSTGSGKTVCMNTIILSLLYQNTAETLRMIMVDPKRVELTMYNGIPHLLTPVITNPAQTVNALKWTIGEMDRRFETLGRAGNRDISSYNEGHPDSKLPHIIFVIDELADLMATSGNDVEAGIIRLAQMARAVGIHLIVATQRPSVDVITGLMKANIPTRIAFSVASIVDSRTILDSPGAEKLLGRGDMLFQTAELSKPVRIQGAFVSEQELKRVIEHLKGDEEPVYEDNIVNKQSGRGTQSLFGGPTDDQDPMFEEAKQAIIEAGKASASLLQRRLKVGYARAARLLDELEEAGIIGPGDGAKPRELLLKGGTSFKPTMNMGGEHNVFRDNNLLLESTPFDPFGAPQGKLAQDKVEEIVEEETEEEHSTPFDEPQPADEEPFDVASSFAEASADEQGEEDQPDVDDVDDEDDQAEEESPNTSEEDTSLDSAQDKQEEAPIEKKTKHWY